MCSKYQNSAQERLETVRRLCYDHFMFSKSGSSNPVPEFFVLPQDWCQAITRDEKLTSLDVFQLVPHHVTWFCRPFLFAYVLQRLALHITEGGFFKFSPRSINVISWTVNSNIKILHPKIVLWHPKTIFPNPPRFSSVGCHLHNLRCLANHPFLFYPSRSTSNRWSHKNK